jgi:hypothetical protein
MTDITFMQPYVVYHATLLGTKAHERPIPFDADADSHANPNSNTAHVLTLLNKCNTKTHLPPSEPLKIFFENPESRKTTHWPILQEAIALCLEKKALLIIPEIGILTHNVSFSTQLLASNLSFHCCDQPLINFDFLTAFLQHIQIQKKLHGALIKQGLQNTTERSGNPNAPEVIRKVNEPKIHAAILFSDLLAPIISEYSKQKASQRNMVRKLNLDGFSAPEGGQWVLSQLQKILERIKLNDLIYKNKLLIQEILEQSASVTPQENLEHKNNLNNLVDQLNKNNIPALRRSGWNPAHVQKLIERTQHLSDIHYKNKFLLAVLQMVHYYQSQNIQTIPEILAAFNQAGIQFYTPITSAALTPQTAQVAPPHSPRNITSWISQINSCLAQLSNIPCFYQELESGYKHLIHYLKIVKIHFSELQKFLSTQHKTLDDLDLPHHLLELKKIFDLLQPSDLKTLAAMTHALKTAPRAPSALYPERAPHYNAQFESQPI